MKKAALFSIVLLALALQGRNSVKQLSAFFSLSDGAYAGQVCSREE